MSKDIHCWLSSFYSLHWDKSNNFKGIETSNHFILVQNLLWDLEHLVSKDFSTVGHGHPCINYFLILKGLEGSEPTLDYQKYNTVVLKLKQ